MLETKTQDLGAHFKVRSIHDREDGFAAVEVERDGQVIEVETHEVALLVDALMRAVSR